MSSGQISVQQRPYSSFRSTTKYSGLTSSPVLLGIRVGSLGSSGKSVRQFAGGVSGNGKSVGSDEEAKRRVPLMKTCRKLPPDSPTLVTTRWQQTQRPSVTYRVSNRYQQVKAVVDTRWTTSSDKTPPCSIHSKSPNGSSGTSVESIVPKYRGGVMATGGSQKRAYQTNLAGKSTKFFNNGINSVAVQRKKSPTRRDFHMKDVEERKKSSQAFSSKFPQGMPFEEEFFRNRRSNSGGVSSNYSSYSNYERQSSTSGFEDEFHRKPSNEPLYVDFSKSIPSSLTPDSSCVDDDGADDVDGDAGSVDENGNPKQQQQRQRLGGKNSKNCRDDGDFYYNFESGGKQRLIVQSKPMVYVAVASWVPKCNTDRQVVATIGNRSGGGSDNSIEEPTTQVKSYDRSSRRHRERSKRSHHRRSPTSGRRNLRHRHRDERSHSNSRRRYRERDRAKEREENRITPVKGGV
ncbi:uncharacterized protein LOC132258156 [Phlebotomus argentipes]|uniref:uncharacterized protein LOC132258156 n=1 Tax=Phlebotomus argentipes TaxID=94469 RepID=UPI0028937F8A|nr:uncharacterized protein LOC132258156 [Phlebotomus argentipes]